MKILLGAMALIAAAQLAGCHGGSASGGAGSPTFTVGGNVSGLTGTGLVLQLNGAGNLPVSANGGFSFAPKFPIGTAYSISVLTSPSGPTQTCTVSGANGVVGLSNVTNVNVVCVSAFTIGGNVTGLSGQGLVLQDNGGDNLPIAADGPFTFATPIATGLSYNVTVLSNTPSQICSVAGGTGTVGLANVTTVNVTCTVGFSIANSGPLATQQWHLKNIGQNAFADIGGIIGMDINVEPVFLNFGFTGAGVITAVVDTGMEITHEDLAANVVPGGSWNFNTGTTDPTNTVDIDGDHGTSVSGLIAMARNSVGGIGVAPSASLKGFNFLSSTQSDLIFIDSLGGSTANPKSDDVFVFNQSFGISTVNDVAIDPTHEAQYLSGVTTLRGGKGALYVKAAGNGFVDIDPVSFPNNCIAAHATQTFASGTFTGLSCENANFDPENTIPYQVVVGATNANGVRASYSTAGSAIWVSAPAGEFGRNEVLEPGFPSFVYSPAMVTTDQSGCAKGRSRNTVNNGSSFDNGSVPNTACNYTNAMNGTSSATPVTVGVIALMLEANPALTWRDVKHILASTARQIDAARPAVAISLSNGTYVAEPAWTPNHATPTPFNFHNWYGFGMVDASAAVTMANTFTANQFGAFVNTGVISSGALNIAIPDNSVTGASSTLTVPANPVHVVEAVQISVSATHPAIGDLGIELLSPLGTRSVLKNIRDGFAGSANLNGMVLLSNAFYGENPVGVWTLKVVDGSGANATAGTLTGWTLRVYGH